MKEQVLKCITKISSALLIFSILISFAGCAKEEESGNSLKNIQLTEEERKWVNPDEKYEDLLLVYGKKKCKGTFVVATDDDIVCLYAENATEKDGKTLESQNTVYDIASCSKVFTAVSILQLQEKGKLDINDTIDKYFPDYPEGKRIKIYNLLHMNSGIPDYLNEPALFFGLEGDALDDRLRDLYSDRISDEELLNTMYKAPLLYEPGSAMTYSNTNYKLLAYIIEKVSKMKYCDYLKKYIKVDAMILATAVMGTAKRISAPASVRLKSLSPVTARESSTRSL